MSDFVLLPEGEYKLQIKTWGFDRSPKGEQKPYFWLGGPVVAKLVEIEGELVEEELEERVNRKVRLYLSPAAVQMTRGRLKKIGYPHDTLAQINPTDENAFDFGKLPPIQVTVSHQDGNSGKTWENVEITNRRTAHNFKDDELDQVLALADETLANLDKEEELPEELK